MAPIRASSPFPGRERDERLPHLLAEDVDGAGSRYDGAACEAAIRLFREEGFAFTQ